MYKYLLILLFFASCTPQKRLNRLIGNHPYLAKEIVRDTVLTTVDHDTIYIPERTIDTFFSASVDTFVVSDSGVTVTVTKAVDRWKIKTVVKRDTIYHSDTVKISYTDKVAEFIVQPISTSDIWKYRKQGALWLIILLIILFLLQLCVRLYLKGQIPFLKL